jgi:hypothetical protein
MQACRLSVREADVWLLLQVCRLVRDVELLSQLQAIYLPACVPSLSKLAGHAFPLLVPWLQLTSTLLQICSLLLQWPNSSV